MYLRRALGQRGPSYPPHPLSVEELIVDIEATGARPPASELAHPAAPVGEQPPRR